MPEGFLCREANRAHYRLTLTNEWSPVGAAAPALWPRARWRGCSSKLPPDAMFKHLITAQRGPGGETPTAGEEEEEEVFTSFIKELIRQFLNTRNTLLPPFLSLSLLAFVASSMSRVLFLLQMFHLFHRHVKIRCFYFEPWWRVGVWFGLNTWMCHFSHYFQNFYTSSVDQSTKKKDHQMYPESVLRWLL